MAPHILLMVDVNTGKLFLLCASQFVTMGMSWTALSMAIDVKIPTTQATRQYLF
jgi:hypothetical protein